MHETPLGPSTSGSVVLELGPGIGALVLHTPPELDGAEIEISPVPASQASGDPAKATGAPAVRTGAPAVRTHSQVRQRLTPGGAKFAAVYPGLAAGDYTIWRDACTSVITVTIHGGQVTTARWPGDAQPGDAQLNCSNGPAP